MSMNTDQLTEYCDQLNTRLRDVEEMLAVLRPGSLHYNTDARAAHARLSATNKAHKEAEALEETLVLRSPEAVPICPQCGIAVARAGDVCSTCKV